MVDHAFLSVRYDRQADGTIDITVLTPDATALRIDTYPDIIRKAVQDTFRATLTPLERQKLAAAEDMGEPAYTAVWDDLVSQRAETLLRVSLSHPERQPHGPAPNDRSTRFTQPRERDR